MDTLALIILIFLTGSILTYLSGKISQNLPGFVSVITTAAAAILFFTTDFTNQVYSFSVASLNLEWSIDAYGMFFMYIVLGLGLLANIYSIAYMQGKEKLGAFYTNFLLSIGAMFGIIISKDFVSFFIFWEIMTWSSFLIVIWNGKEFKKIGLWYMIFSAIGAYAMLMGIVMVYAEIGSFSIIDFITMAKAGEINTIIPISILLLVGFAVKAAVMPLHVWAPRAYANAPMAYTSVFSGALSKMGVFGMGIVLISIFKFSVDLSTMFTETLIRNVIAWLGAITAAMATIYAIRQDDAKKLLAYSSVAQLGYIVVGLAIGTKLAVMAALFLAILHAIFKGALFMAIGAVEKQAGTTDMTKISGLINKMPWTFFVTLLSIIALAGIPPLGGFVGKWMLYESLITNGNYFLVIVIFFSSTAAFLYSYRILFGLFLGQEEKETENVKEASFLMIIPMLLLSLSLVLFGTYPGLIFEPIAKAMETLGFSDVNWNMTVLSNVWGNTVNLQYISIIIGVLAIIALAFLSFKGRRGTRGVSTKDISTSGEIPTENENLTFQLDFYKPFERAAAPLYKRSMTKIYTLFGNGVEALFDFTRKIYTGNGQTYALYVVIFLTILLLFSQNILK
jgi:NADH-quinone oxidoreductase subunit M